jgi:hypothetical protein
MSFQDFNKNPTHRKGGNAAGNFRSDISPNASSVLASPWPMATGSGSSASSTSKISEILTQYQVREIHGERFIAKLS